MGTFSWLCKPQRLLLLANVGLGFLFVSLASCSIG